MKQTFITKKFGADAVGLLSRIETILDDYSTQGYDLSLRQLYYQLVAANIVPNSERSYKNIGNLVSDARLAGLIDWSMITDRGRVTVGGQYWDNPAQILDTVTEGFVIDKWATQPSYIEVMVEKQALEGVLIPVCRELDVRFTANKGYSSSSALYETGRRLRDRLYEDKRVSVIYLGDHDPSGIDMTRDIDDRLNMFAGYTEGDTQRVNVYRVALNMDQIKALNPPENPAKMTDSRASDYVEKYGSSSWELDAIEPKRLAALVRNFVLKIRDKGLWDEACEREEAMRDELRAFAKKSKFST